MTLICRMHNSNVESEPTGEFKSFLFFISISTMVKSPSNAKHSVTTLGNIEEVAKVFKKFDANGDRKISAFKRCSMHLALIFLPRKSIRQFSLERIGRRDENSSKELRDASDLYDQDGNELISAKKLHAVLESLGENSSLRDCLKMIKYVDVDGDGCVNFECIYILVSSSSNYLSELVVVLFVFESPIYCFSPNTEEKEEATMAADFLFTKEEMAIDKRSWVTKSLYKAL
ncbi:hypothetical protein ACSBR2_007531 [Camellia fascicularis]